LEDRKRCQSGLKILVQYQYPGRTSRPIAKGRSPYSGCVHVLVRFSKGPMGDGTEGESDAGQSVHEGQSGIRSRHRIEHGDTNEVQSLMKGQVYWRGVSVLPDI